MGLVLTLILNKSLPLLQHHSGIQSNLQHECQAGRRRVRHEQHERDTSDTSATRVRQEQHECDTSATGTTQVLHECYTNGTSARLVRNFDLDNSASKNIFSYTYIYYVASKSLQEEEQYHSKNCLLEMPCSHAKMCLKSAPQKLNFLVAKLYSRLQMQMPFYVPTQLSKVSQPHFQ